MTVPGNGPPPVAIRDALRALGIRNLLLGVHDSAFPSRPEEDLGRGSPYSRGAAEFLGFARTLGFDGLQLGPQGKTSATNPSPYDGALFSRNPPSLAFLPLTREEGGCLLRPEHLAEAVASSGGVSDRVDHRGAHAAATRLAAEVVAAWRRRPVPARFGAAEFAAFRRRQAAWLERDALYEVLRRRYGGRSWREWTREEDRRLWHPAPGRETAVAARRAELLARHRDAVEAYAFVQFLIHRQHRQFQSRAARLGLKLFADLQIGMSERDAWFADGFVLETYRMGAPPSRTNPDGQPWGYPVPDPACYEEAGPGGGRRPGPAVRFLRDRLEKLFEEFDGVRIDHPHGLVCPWVYRADAPDPVRAVQEGARLFASPDLPDHPELARYAVVRPDQLDRSVPRHADGWVRDLSADQVDRYGTLFEVVMEAAGRTGRGVHEVACEILSTQPYPLGRVLERHGLGRFRVTQKVDLGRDDDVYRSENARPEDWVMLGSHDTRPIWLVAEEWYRSGAARAHAAYLAGRLLAPGEDRAAWAARVAADPGELAQAKAAELFVGPARNVMIFFTDLFGWREPYNRPGTVGGENWSARIAPGFAAGYAARRAEGRALDLPRALARALRARGAAFAGAHRELLAALDRLAVHHSRSSGIG